MAQPEKYERQVGRSRPLERVMSTLGGVIVAFFILGVVLFVAIVVADILPVDSRWTTAIGILNLLWLGFISVQLSQIRKAIARQSQDS